MGHAFDAQTGDGEQSSHCIERGLAGGVTIGRFLGDPLQIGER